MVSEQAKQIIGQAQAYQQQLQAIMAQKENMKLQSTELEKAIKDVTETKETSVYKMSGPVLLKTRKADALKDLKEKQEFIRTQLNAMEKNEEKLKSRLEELRGKLAPQKGAGG